MPFKADRDRRHHIPKQQHRVTNWAAYDAGLRARGSLTVWWLLSASGVVGLSHATRPATRALSRALPRRRALCTNWKNPR